MQTYGIAYKPSTRKVRKYNLHDFNDGYIRLQWVDFTNITRCRVIPYDAFVELLKCARPGVGVTQAVFGLIDVALALGFSGTGEYLYVPDINSLRPCAYSPGHLSVMGWFEQKLPETKEKHAVDLCPRSQLKKLVEAANIAGVEFLVGMETEFILLLSTNPIKAANDAVWSSTAGIPSESKEAQCMHEIAECLRMAGIELLMYHKEAAPGQYEVVTGPLPPLEAADALVMTRETIFNVAAKHGFRATLAPRVFSDNCGSSAHAHISVHSNANYSGTKIKKNPDMNKSTTMNPLERSFLQGLLTHIPEIAALTLPIEASYARVQDGIWSGGTYVAWGVENRETVVRLTGAPGSHHFEFRPHDGTANPYLALAAIIGMGFRGVREGMELRVAEIPCKAVSLDKGKRKQNGITQRLPRSLAEARDVMRKSAAVQEQFGRDFVEKYLAVNEMMDANLRNGMADAAAEMEKLVLTY